MVHRVLPNDKVESYVDDVVRTLCENAPLAIANSKTIIEEYVKATGSPDHVAMAAAIDRCARSADYEEGRRAFMEKRRPKFQGK
jgi:enoyl-CoA hydratase